MDVDPMTAADAGAAARLAALGERYFAAQHAYDPLNATLLGLDAFDHLAGDPSVEADERVVAELDAVGRAAAALPLDGLDRAGLVDHAVLTALVHGARTEAQHALWAVPAALGYVSRQALLFQAVPAMSAADPAGAERYLSRLAGAGPMLRALADRYAQEAGRGRLPTAVGVRASIRQLATALAEDEASDELLRPARATGGATAERAARLVRDEVRPALALLGAQLQELLPLARPDDQVGVDALSGGGEAYRAAVARHTTTDLTPEAIHAIGLETLDELEAEWIRIGSRALGERTFAGVAERLRTDPALRFGTSAEIVAVARAALERADAARPASFPAWDIPACVIEEVSPVEADHAALAYYRPPAVDGSRPGAHVLLTTDPGSRFRFEVEALAFHESVPGHHLQLATAQTLDIPRYRRYLDVEACSFNEGWGLYAEGFADEAGLYSGDLDRLGMLSMRALRACRLVVDTGIHAMGWSRQQGVDFLWAHTATTIENARHEVDRYIGWPGQALAYLIGRREILRLRSGARQALGSRFDLRAFHGTVLGDGALPLGVLAGVVERWQESAASARGDGGGAAWS